MNYEKTNTFETQAHIRTHTHTQSATLASLDYQGKPLEESKAEETHREHNEKRTHKRRYFMFTKLHG